MNFVDASWHRSQSYVMCVLMNSLITSYQSYTLCLMSTTTTKTGGGNEKEQENEVKILS